MLDATQAHCQPLSSEWLTLAFLGFSGISCTFLYFTFQAIMYFPLLQFAFSCVHNDNSNTPDPFWGTTHCSSESFARFQHTNAFFITVFRPLTQSCTKLWLDSCLILTFCRTALSRESTLICSFLRLALSATLSELDLARTWAISSFALLGTKRMRQMIGSCAKHVSTNCRDTVAHLSSFSSACTLRVWYRCSSCLILIR